MTDLDQFCILAKSQKSRACAALIQQVLSHRKIYVFGELLKLPSVQSLKDTEFRTSFNSLELFAYGTYHDYEENTSNYLNLTDFQLSKLKYLTLVSLASKSKVIPYDFMMKELYVDNIRSLEDITIEAIYTGLIQGKLDPLNQLFHVQTCTARDIKHEEIDQLINTLVLWKGTINNMISTVEKSSNFMSKNRKTTEEESKELQAIAVFKAKEMKEQMESEDYQDNIDYYGFSSHHTINTTSTRHNNTNNSNNNNSNNNNNNNTRNIQSSQRCSYVSSQHPTR